MKKKNKKIKIKMNKRGEFENYLKKQIKGIISANGSGENNENEENRLKIKIRK